MRRWCAVLLTLATTASWAVGKGGPLYIKTKDCKVLDKADLKGKPVATLQPGQEVKWQGADEKNKAFHAIEHAGGKGFTLQQNLSPRKPSLEYLAKDDGKAIDAQAFASSGAATKALSGAALKYSGDKPNLATITKGILTAEGVAAKVTPEQASAHNQKVGGK